MAYYDRACIHYLKGDLSGALTDFDRAIELDPRRADAYAQRGLIYLRQSREVEAERDFAQCLALNPGLKPALERLIQEVQQQLRAK